jgi:hypothetical protein
MNIKFNDIQWFFLLPSSKQAEKRHVYDILYGVFSLEQCGILPNNISVFIDGPNRDIISEDMKYASKNVYDIGTTISFFSYLANHRIKSMILFVTGEGSLEGLGPNIKPMVFLNAIRGIRGLSKAIIYFGQCYSGIFNHLKVYNNPNIVLIGATNLSQSISYMMSFQTVKGEQRKVLNLFLYYVFEWLTNLIDVDGDSSYSILDSYKYASSKTNDLIIRIKSSKLLYSVEIGERIEKLKDKLKTDLEDAEYDRLSTKLLCHEQAYILALDISFNCHEPWISNIEAASKMCLSRAYPLGQSRI